MAVVVDDIDVLGSALDAVCGADAVQLGDPAYIQVLHRQLERLNAAVTRATVAFDASRAWEADGARSAAAWLAGRCRLPVATARRRVALGRALRHMPVVEAAWLAGDIGEAQVGLFASARTERTAACFGRDESLLVGQARRLRYSQFARALAYWAQLADPDGSDDTAAAQHRNRRLHLSPAPSTGPGSFAGSWVLDGVLIVAEVLAGIEDELFKADWAEAKARVGEGVCAAGLARTPAQRRADALVEMARRAAARPAGSRWPEPLFSVVVGYETFAGRICELADGTVVAPGSLLRWLAEGWVERVVFDGPDRIRNVGVRRRIFSGASRRAVELRDRECFHELCEEPAEECEIDHIRPWATGGLTVEDNGRPACGFHNRARHRSRPPP